MGLPASVKWYHILFAGILIGANESYHYTVFKIAETYDRTCDGINTSSNLIQTNTTLLLRHLGLLDPAPAFEMFGDLPTEIRTLVWQFAMMEPRVIELRKSGPTEGPHSAGKEKGIWSIARVPSVLHACRESRIEALKVYDLAFGTRVPTVEPRVYVNFARDIVFFGKKCEIYSVLGWDMIGSVLMDDVKKIKRVAIRVERSWAWVIRALEQDVLKGVREAVIVGQSGGECTFDLGRTPGLMVCGESSGEDIEWGRISSTRSEFKKKVVERMKELAGESKAEVKRSVLVRDGTFVKGLGDRWYCPKRRWPF